MIPASFHAIADLSFAHGHVEIACKDDRQAIHLAVEGGPFDAGEARRIRDKLTFAIDVLPEMYKAREAGLDPAGAIEGGRA